MRIRFDCTLPPPPAFELALRGYMFFVANAKRNIHHPAGVHRNGSIEYDEFLAWWRKQRAKEREAIEEATVRRPARQSFALTSFRSDWSLSRCTCHSQYQIDMHAKHMQKT